MSRTARVEWLRVRRGAAVMGSLSAAVLRTVEPVAGPATFDEQRIAYFRRPSRGRPDGRIDHVAAWRGAELDPATWTFPLTESEIAELGRLADRLIEAGTDMATIDDSVVDLPVLAERITAWQAALRNGLGVVLLRGIPVREWGDEKTAMAYWCLGHAIGRPGPQNPDGELLGHVIDYGEADQPLVRLYRTAADIRFHCDAADVVGLLALRTAKEGGASRIASSTAIYNELVDRRPELAAELFETFQIDRRNEEGPGESPVFELPPAAWDGELLRVFWHSDYSRSADRHDAVEISPLRRDLIETFDAIGAEPGMRLDMELEEGDIQFISNHTVVHSRTAYVDHDDLAERRHLLRLWLTVN